MSLAKLFACALLLSCMYCAADAAKTYKKFGSSTVRINVDEQHSFFFFPVVDDFTLMDIAGFHASYDHVNESNNETLPVQVQVEIDGVMSEYLTYRTPDYIVPFMTAIINLDQGEVKSIAWDKVCDACLADACIDGANCGVAWSECGVSKTNCDLKVYVTWIGTDSSGDYCTSAGRRLSQFRSYSLVDMYKEASNSVQQEVDRQIDYYRNNQPL